MNHKRYKDHAYAMVDAFRAVADAAREWAGAIDGYAAVMRDDAELETPWAEVETAAMWARREEAAQYMRATHRALADRLQDEERAADALRAAKLAYYEACAAEGTP